MRERADRVLVARGLAETRAKAQEAIEAGQVHVDGEPVRKAAQLIDADAEIVCAPAHAWVSRAGLKLDHALRTFGVPVACRNCLDLGASTGGFTDVLLAHGAARVAAIDVGHGQLHPRIAADVRVIAFEGLDARAVTSEHLGFAPEVVVADLSFIGLAKALPIPLSLAAPAARLVALVKPQYERGPGGRGLLPSAEAREVAERVRRELDGLAGFVARDLIESPIPGGDGAQEFLYWAEKDAAP